MWIQRISLLLKTTKMLKCSLWNQCSNTWTLTIFKTYQQNFSYCPSGLYIFFNCLLYPHAWKSRDEYWYTSNGCSWSKRFISSIFTVTVQRKMKNASFQMLWRSALNEENERSKIKRDLIFQIWRQNHCWCLWLMSCGCMCHVILGLSSLFLFISHI